MGNKKEPIIFNLFTDGSSLIKDSYYESSSAFVLTISTKCIPIIGGGKFHINGTISKGEAHGVLLGMKNVTRLIEKSNINPKDAIIRVYLDSAFVKDSLTKWIKTWCKQGKDNIWINSEKKPVAHQDIFKKIFYNYIKDKKYKIEFYKINGHIGEKISFKEALKKFKTKNKVNISDNEFKNLVEGNHIVDKIAEKVRTEKLYDYFKRYKDGGADECLLYLRNQRVVIRKRKK